jgi:hypothetical protein
MRLRGFIAAALLALTALAGCGGGSERDSLLSKLSDQLHHSSSSLNQPKLDDCILAQAKKLPTSQLRQATSSGSSDRPAAQKLGLGLAAPCVSQGYGASAIRTQLLSQIGSSTGLAQVPAPLSACIRQRFAALPNSALGQMLSQGSQPGSSPYAAGAQVGRRLATGCLGQPAVLALLRQKFLAPIRSGAASSHFSPAFSRCLLQRAQAVPTTALRQMFMHPDQAQATGQALGRKWARACIASGIRP